MLPNVSGASTIAQHPTNRIMLTGADLLAKVKELGDTPRDQVCEACGYVNKAGKPAYTAFYEALMDAKGVSLAPPTSKAKPKKGKPLSWNVAVSKTGVIPVSAGYAALLGLQPGDRVAIEHDVDALVLTKIAADGTAPTPVADAVPVATITTPAAAAEPALAPF